MSTRKLSTLIGTFAGLGALNKATQRIAALQQLYEACAPPELIQSSRVVADRGGELVIAADNNAIAAKLRQLAPRLLKNLQKQSAEVNGIQVRVQVSVPRTPGRTATEKPQLSIDLIENFENLAGRVKDPGLSAALHRFAGRRRRA